MAFIIRRTQELAQLDTVSKVIKADDFWQYQQAREMMSSAREKRDQILDAALAGFEAEQSRGYRQGRDEARQEQAQKMIGVISQTVDYFSKIEAQMVDLVLDAVRRIIDDFDDREKVLKVVRNALTMVRNQRQILIRVHPVNVAEIKSQVNDLKQSFPGIEQMEVSADVSLDKDACVIESDMGQVEASMSGQMEALKTSFGRVFGAIPETGQDRNSISVGTNS
jgi:type III secretion protein L